MICGAFHGRERFVAHPEMGWIRGKNTIQLWKWNGNPW